MAAGAVVAAGALVAAGAAGAAHADSKTADAMARPIAVVKFFCISVLLLMKAKTRAKGL